MPLSWCHRYNGNKEVVHLFASIKISDQKRFVKILGYISVRHQLVLGYIICLIDPLVPGYVICELSSSSGSCNLCYTSIISELYNLCYTSISSGLCNL